MTATALLPASGLDALIAELTARGYEVHAPVLERGALVIRPVGSAAELPRGVVDEQAPGHHRLRSGGSRLFDYTVPADSWKRVLFPPRLRLWQAARTPGDLEVRAAPAEPRRLALLGVRACDLEAILVQDRVFLEGSHPDPHYLARREGAFIVAVNCARATSTCFCASLGTGPRAQRGYDLALTELAGGDFLVDALGERGGDVLAALPVEAATAGDRREAEAMAAATAASMTRTMPAGIAGTLRAAASSPRWQAIADRCLGCGNCTLVCPTCFCFAVEHTSDLAGVATQERRWDSCFSGGHSYIHGGSVRPATAPRYRQWLTHKLSTWQDQFGTPGCTGCGRCLTWCPVGIDITAEAHAFTAEAAGGAP